MDYLEDVIESLKPILKKYGFKKKDLNWYKEDAEIITVFNIQKSSYGKQVYLNTGIFIKALENNREYAINKCHVQCRLDSLIGREFLDFENGIDNVNRSLVFSSLIESNPYKFFTLSGSLGEIKKFISETETLVVFERAKDYLNIQ